jgi:hypothetical protein
MEGITEGSVDLVTSIFRLAVADFLGKSYSHDCDAPTRSVRSRYRESAAAFLISPWAAYLADLIGLEATAIWREVRRLDRLEDSTELIHWRAA